MEKPVQEHLLNRTRRNFLANAGLSLGAVALADLQTGHRADAADNPLAPKVAHFPRKAKRVIYLHMTGSPPNLDLYDYKPKLIEMDGQEAPASFIQGKEFAFTSGTPKLLGTRHQFEKCGQSGLQLSDCLPNLKKHADEMCIIHSMHTEQFNHAPAELLIYTGSPRSGRPSFGSWLTYGLGSENENLPAFVVLISSGVQPNGGKNSFGSGFLPSVFQGVQCRSKGDPVLYASDPPGMDRDLRRKTLDAIRDLNAMQASELGHPETATRIAQYELAFRMQTSVPDVMDITRESQLTLDEYGAKPGDASFANNCLLARRLVEQGVRFVQLFNGAYQTGGEGVSNWDGHKSLAEQYAKHGPVLDQPCAAMLKDLKRRGLLSETLVVWVTEFGRMPTFQKGASGRDHNPEGFTAWMMGAGVTAPFSYGATDEFGYRAIENASTVYDLHATILHLLGLDHERLTYYYNGFERRLTDVHGHVLKDLLT